jgi:glycosyltransferase involved in cell wall biosynthesis
MNDLISIVVPIYNGERYLAECLDSLKTQYYQNIEMILVDDGSTDHTADICHKYISEDHRFHYIYQKNSGQNAARKKGVEYASGNWVMFVDSDDFVTEDYCSSFISLQRQADADLVFGRLQRFQNGIYGRKSQILSGVLSGNEVLANILNSRFFELAIGGLLVPVLFRRKIIYGALRNVDMRIHFSEDCACIIACLCKVKRVTFLSKVVYFYRQNALSCCHSHEKSTLVDEKLFRQNVLRRIKELPNEDAVKRKMDWLIVSGLLLGGYEYFWDFPGLYPFGEIAAGKRIVIYGAGVLGEELYNKFPKHLELAACVDRQADYYRSLGKPVFHVEELDNLTYDYIAIATINPGTSDEIERELQKMRIPTEKILRISERWIDSTYTENKLRELENVDENYCYIPSTVS